MLVEIKAGLDAKTDFHGIAVDNKYIGEEHFFGRWEFAFATAAEVAEIELAGLRCRFRHDNVFDPLLRHVAKTTVGAATALDSQRYGGGPVTLDRVGNAHEKAAAMDDLLAEELVRVDLALGEFGLAEHDGVIAGFETEGTLIHVETVIDRPVDLECIARVEYDITKDVLRRGRIVVGCIRGSGSEQRHEQQDLSDQRAWIHRHRVTSRVGLKIDRFQ